MPSTSIPSRNSIPNTQKLKTSQQYILGKHNLLASFDDLESLVVDDEILTEKDRSGVLHHMLEVRAAMAHVLW